MGIPKNTFLTKDRLDDAESSLKAEAMRERDSVNARRNRLTETGKPGSPYYQPEDTDTQDEKPVRAVAQGKYVKANSYGARWNQDEGFLAPTARMADMLMKGKSLKESTDMNNILGDRKLREGAKQAGKEAIENYRSAKENQKEYGMKKGGKVKSASARADGCCVRGKTRA